jgi:hypothetical protein
MVVRRYTGENASVYLPCMAKLSPKEATALIRRIKPENIKLAPQVEITALEPFVDRVLNIIGHPEALVTDESIVGHFLPIFPDERPAELARLAQKLGFPVESRDTITDIALKLRNAEKPAEKS